MVGPRVVLQANSEVPYGILIIRNLMNESGENRHSFLNCKNKKDENKVCHLKHKPIGSFLRNKSHT